MLQERFKANEGELLQMLGVVSGLPVPAFVQKKISNQ